MEIVVSTLKIMINQTLTPNKWREDRFPVVSQSRHWRRAAGAAADSWFAHLAFEVPGEKTSNEWLEPVTDEEYNKLEQAK